MLGIVNDAAYGAEDGGLGNACDQGCYNDDENKLASQKPLLWNA
jgi:hypothetical protein